jgi:diamine N-acetyltransferase
MLHKWPSCTAHYFRRMIVLRPLTIDDAPLLATVGRQTLLESHGHSAPAEVMQAYVDRSFSEAACRAELEDSGNIFYGAFYEGALAGYFKIIMSVPHPAVALQPSTKLERLYLLNTYLDLKLGHQLLQKAIELSKAAGEKSMWLNVWKENGRAIRFYEKQGFVTVGESDFVLTEAHSNPNWVMVVGWFS